MNKNGIDDLDSLLSLDYHLDRQHLIECRLGDIAYSLLGTNLSIVDQVKSARERPNGLCDFRAKDSLFLVEHMSLFLVFGRRIVFDMHRYEKRCKTRRSLVLVWRETLKHLEKIPAWTGFPLSSPSENCHKERFHASYEPSRYQI